MSKNIYLKTKKRGNLYLTENRLCRNEMWFAADNLQLYVSHMCKRILDSNFYQVVVDKISNFHEIISYFTYSQKS